MTEFHVFLLFNLVESIGMITFEILVIKTTKNLFIYVMCSLLTLRGYYLHFSLQLKWLCN